MTLDYAEGRVAELEHALEDLLECFDMDGPDYLIEVKMPQADGIQEAPCAVGEIVRDTIDDVCDVLYGGAAIAEEA